MNLEIRGGPDSPIVVGISYGRQCTLSLACWNCQNLYRWTVMRGDPMIEPHRCQSCSSYQDNAYLEWSIRFLHDRTIDWKNEGF